MTRKGSKNKQGDRGSLEEEEELSDAKRSNMAAREAGKITEMTANGPFAASGQMVHAGGQAAHWDIQNKATSSR